MPYERAIQEELHEPDYGYDLPNYDGLILQSDPPMIQMPNYGYETLELNANNDYTYPTERPGFDPASGMTVSEYNRMYDRRFPNGDTGVVIANPGPLSSAQFPGRGINAPVSRSQPVFMDEMEMLLTEARMREAPVEQRAAVAAPLAQMVVRPDTSRGLVQVGPLSSGNARPVKFNDALDSYYDEANNKLNIVY
jgi:hypothetical protein